MAKKNVKNKTLPLDVEKKLARLEAFTTVNPRPVIEIDLKGNVLDANSSAKKLFPDLEKLGPKHPYLSDLPTIVTFFKQEKSKKIFRREIKIGDAWFKQLFFYVPHFKLIHIYASDATDRKKAEKALQESEWRYRSLFNKMSEGYCLNEIILNKKGEPVDYRFLDVNPAFEEMTGLTRQKLIGKRITELLPETQIQWITDYGHVALSGKPVHLERFDEKTNKYYEVFVYKPADMQFAILYLDITDMKRAEEEKNHFISIMSHELRNPLTPILAAAQLLQATVQDSQKKNEKEAKQHADIIARQAKTMARLLDDLLDMSRMSRNRIMLDTTTVNVADIINNVVETTSPLMVKQQHRLLVVLPKQPVYIKADPVRLEQILVNLVNNAIKYTKPRGRIQVTLETEGKQATIAVKDNGVGISAKKIDTIFTLFNHAGPRPFVYMGGLGIGLNITKHLVNMQEGTIVAKSKGKNKGSEFIITFPLQPAPLQDTPAIMQPTKTPQQEGRIKRVLVVEDNEDISSLLSRMLALSGYQTKVANKGRYIAKVYKEFKPDAALIDIGLPDISGYEVAQKLRTQALALGRNITLIAVTGYGQDKDRQKARAAGFDHHLTKPIDMANLFKLLRA